MIQIMVWWGVKDKRHYNICFLIDWMWTYGAGFLYGFRNECLFLLFRQNSISCNVLSGLNYSKRIASLSDLF